MSVADENVEAAITVVRLTIQTTRSLVESLMKSGSLRQEYADMLDAHLGALAASVEDLITASKEE